jgi:hypothetical protein
MDHAGKKETAQLYAPGALTIYQDSLVHFLSRGGCLAVFPILFYLIIFCIYTYPLVLEFSTHFFADQGDGLQNVWNIWWVNKAVTQLHQLPWHTSYLHYPNGVSLLGSTLNPFNGFMGIILLPFLTLVETHNGIVVFSFVFGGVTTFWLAYYLTGSYWGSILAGFIFTFSNYHFAHAEGHLQLVSLEWIPLFVLCWYVLLTKPSIPLASAAAAALVAVLLCDYYYFFYCVVTGGMMVVWYAVEQRDFFFFLKRKYLIPCGIFVALVLITAGPLVVSLLLLNVRDPLLGFHSPVKSSLDLLAPIIPGGHGYFAPLTEPFWSHLTVNIHESSVHMGISVLFVLSYVWLKRRECRVESLRFWFGTLVFFAVMSLGPVLHIWGREMPFIRLPYALLETIFPPLKLSGAPVRMMVMVMLSASVICAVGFTMLKGKRWLVVLVLMMLFVEYLPKPLPASQPIVPPYVQFVKTLPDDGGIIDVVSRPTRALYFQTVHEKPVAFGYVARIPSSVHEEERTVKRLVRDRDYSTLFCDYHFKYLVAPFEQEVAGDNPSMNLLYQDSSISIYDLEASSLCGNGI